MQTIRGRGGEQTLPATRSAPVIFYEVVMVSEYFSNFVCSLL